MPKALTALDNSHCDAFFWPLPYFSKIFTKEMRLPKEKVLDYACFPGENDHSIPGFWIQFDKDRHDVLRLQFTGALPILQISGECQSLLRNHTGFCLWVSCWPYKNRVYYGELSFYG